MQRKQTNQQTRQKTMNWLKIVYDCLPRLAVPVGPRFQADLPACTSSPNDYGGDGESDTLRWLGTRTWPIKGKRTETNRGVIGKGRPDFCRCESPGSVECIQIHITDKRIQLQFDLGPAFWVWKFDEMGEDVSKLWTSQEQRNFESLVKLNPLSEGKSFLKPAWECFSSKPKESIVSYYFNVFVPRRIGMLTRSGCKIVDSDDDEAREELSIKDSRKRYQDDHDILHCSKTVKTRYLTGRR
ncbi:AT-rich interactive domain-containing protein 2-like [Malania oleifera]|uniref:AT-rich interactive domain-containing protein 2-like n=1 Tax=Malania oleifera TaxID=397392 RepID=UPI0025AE6F09|nr:AT-rich interactive domain-containing protein 2-like [Malania oleifera]XP_057953234.1 AT-rich interactive domain-containing protein 2-like [Malania oleifera]XP_057953235.1 AT-rich interactive domain-containing protein 2-like [Malania oleifera]XP_057953236.1 AT-rich interactive domain-containing protein 2-like [Malania oleifera]